MTKLANPVPLFLDTTGALMDGGYIYVGAVNGDPQVSQINLYWDSAQSQPAEQPLRTIGGQIVNGVTPSPVFFSQSDYAMRVSDQNDVLVFYSPSIYADASFQPLDSDLTAIAALGTTPFGRSLLTLANAAALASATGVPASLALTGGTMTGDILRQGAGGYVYTTTGTGAKIYPPLPVGTTNPATGPLSLQGFLLMLSQIDTDGTVRTHAQLTQVDTDGVTVRQLKELWQNDAGGTPRLIFSSGSSGGATVSPDYVQGTRASRGAVSVTTASVTASLARPGFTALTWTFADPGWSVASPGALSTAFRSPSLGPNEDASTTVYLTATFASGPDAVSNSVTLYANNSYIDTGIS